MPESTWARTTIHEGIINLATTTFCAATGDEYYGGCKPDNLILKRLYFQSYHILDCIENIQSIILLIEIRMFDYPAKWVALLQSTFIIKQYPSCHTIGQPIDESGQVQCRYTLGLHFKNTCALPSMALKKKTLSVYAPAK